MYQSDPFDGAESKSNGWCQITIRRKGEEEEEDESCMYWYEWRSGYKIYTLTHTLFSLSLEHLQMHTLKLLGVHHPHMHSSPYIYGPKTKPKIQIIQCSVKTTINPILFLAQIIKTINA